MGAPQKRNIFLIGPMGAGKTSIGKELAKQLGLTFHDSDQVIEEKTGADIPWIFDLEGEQGFRKRESDIIDELTQLNDIVLATGGGSVIKPENRQLLSSRGTVIYLQTAVDTQFDRVRRSQHRPLIKTEKPEQKLTELLNKRDKLYREIADYVICTDGMTVPGIVKEIKAMINR